MLCWVAFCSRLLGRLAARLEMAEEAAAYEAAHAQQLDALLARSFPHLGVPELRAVTLKCLAMHPRLPARVLDALALRHDPDAAPGHVRPVQVAALLRALDRTRART